MTLAAMKSLGRSRVRGARGERGFIIVAVLWILLALAVLASAYALYTSNTAAAARASSDRLQADALITAGLELTTLRLLGRTTDDPRSSGDFQFHMGGADIAVRFRSEGARIDLNEATKELLAGLFATLGAKTDEAASYADRIIGWRTKNKTPQNKEADAYADAGLKYAPRQAPFENVAELRFVLGIPPKLVEAAMPFVTIFNGLPQIDVMAAPPEVVSSLPGIDPDVVNAILTRRGAQDPKGHPADPRPRQGQRLARPAQGDARQPGDFFQDRPPRRRRSGHPPHGQGHGALSHPRLARRSRRSKPTLKIRQHSLARLTLISVKKTRQNRKLTLFCGVARGRRAPRRDMR